jgi:hypothetical protein
MHDRDHVISVVLTNEDWKAFLQIQPEPVSWLKERIRERIAAERSTATSATAQAQSRKQSN